MSADTSDILAAVTTHQGDIEKALRQCVTYLSDGQLVSAGIEWGKLIAYADAIQSFDAVMRTAIWRAAQAEQTGSESDSGDLPEA